MQFPKDLKYTKEHEWAKIDGKTITVGITEHAQRALGDVVFVELPAVGRTVKAGETFGVVESIKAVSDLYAPVSGKVVEINTALPDNPGQLNVEPYGSAWIIKIDVSDPAATASLLDSEAYSAFVNSIK